MRAEIGAAAGDHDAPRIERVTVSVYRIPTDAPEWDGTVAWDVTVMAVEEVEGGGRRGTGYSYTHEAAAALVRDTLAPAVPGRDAVTLPAAWDAMVHAVRDIGHSGVAATAISAVDMALWDLWVREGIGSVKRPIANWA